MRPALASELSDHPVVGTDGTELGTLHDLTADLASGELSAFLIEPADPALREEFETTAAGRLRVPAVEVVALDDQLVIHLPGRIDGSTLPG
jgi:sporulation protein YlmC with PRC-barrel domain